MAKDLALDKGSAVPITFGLYNGCTLLYLYTLD